MEAFGSTSSRAAAANSYVTPGVTGMPPCESGTNPLCVCGPTHRTFAVLLSQLVFHDEFDLTVQPARLESKPPFWTRFCWPCAKVATVMSTAATHAARQSSCRRRRSTCSERLSLTAELMKTRI